MDSPEEVVKVGDEIEVKILRVDRGERKIGLSRKKAQWNKGEGEREEGATGRPTRAAEAPKETKELKGGLGGGGPLFSIGGPDATADRAGRRAGRGSGRPDLTGCATISDGQPSTISEPPLRPQCVERRRFFISHRLDVAVPPLGVASQLRYSRSQPFRPVTTRSRNYRTISPRISLEASRFLNYFSQISNICPRFPSRS